jgi:hypothetical protein
MTGMIVYFKLAEEVERRTLTSLTPTLVRLTEVLLCCQFMENTFAALHFYPLVPWISYTKSALLLVVIYLDILRKKSIKVSLAVSEMDIPKTTSATSNPSSQISSSQSSPSAAPSSSHSENENDPDEID